MDRANMKHVLQMLGYQNENISENYSVQISGTSAVKYDMVAFSDRYLRDVSTSCIALQEAADEMEEEVYIDGAKYLAAPVLIIAMEDHLRVWNIKPDKNILINDGNANVIQLYFEKNRFEFMSDTLIASKMGYKQLDFFESVGLIDFSREATCKILSEEFEKGFLAAKACIKSMKKINGQDLNNLTSITMHVISALIINSKIYAQEQLTDIWQLLTKLSQNYGEYFDDKVMKRYGKELPCAIFDSLNHNINYQSVDHELLGFFYESTLLQLSKEKAGNIRKKFGIYYTPKALSQEISLAIPFEKISVDHRYVLDGTCGSGSLLLSACKRLEDLIRLEHTDFDKQEYLTNMIQGYDVDRFASEVAKLSFLLYSLPYSGNWNIKAGDLLRLNNAEIQIPYVILGNPPYKEERKDSARTQKAAAFLERYLDWLHEDGYIGMILPESFMQNDSVKKQREELLRRFDILELWMLPGQIFENNCATIVLIAQKVKVEKNNITKIRILTRNRYSIKRYLKYHDWDFEFLADIQSTWLKDQKMKVSPVEGILRRITENTRMIDKLTYNGIGIMMPPDINCSEQQYDGWVPYLANADSFRKYVISNAMRECIRFINYAMTDDEQTKMKRYYKGFRLRKGYEHIYASKSKVLVKLSSTPGEIDCIAAFVDEDQIYPEHSFFCFASHDPKISNYILCALINSKIINAYIRRECVKRTLITKAVRSIPVPEFTDYQLKKIEDCYFVIREACLREDNQTAAILQDQQNQIDEIIYDAFGLDSNEKNQIDRMFDIYHGKKINKKKKIMPKAKYCNVTGEVLEINIEKMMCKVYLSEFGDSNFNLSASMPGWFLRERAEFSAKLSNGRLFDIKPLLYSYVEDEELFTMLMADMS